MQVHSFLVQGAGAAAAAAVASRLSRLCASTQLDCLVIFNMGCNHAAALNAVQAAFPPRELVPCPVCLTETYGILGYDDEIP
jgi:hypothetical protein